MPPVIMADEQHHLLPVRALIDLFGAEVLPFKDRDAHPSVVLPGEVVDGAFGVGIGADEQLVNGHPEHGGHGGEEGDIGAGELALPLGDGLGGDPQTVCQELLGQSRGTAVRRNILPQSGKFVFHGQDSFQRCYGKQAASCILYHRGREFGKQPMVVFFVFLIYFGHISAKQKHIRDRTYVRCIIRLILRMGTMTGVLVDVRRFGAVFRGAYILYYKCPHL